MPRSSIEIRHVQCVISAAECGSFRLAAQALGIEQSAVSRRIRDIESEIGGKLFHRHHSGVDLTDVGRQFLERARAGMDQIDAALNAAKLVAQETCGLRVGFFVPLAVGFLAELFRIFRTDRPEVRIEYVEAGSAEIIRAIRRGQMDVGFVTEIPPGAGYELVPLWNEPVCLAMSIEDSLARRATVTWDDIADRHFIVTDAAPGPDVANCLRRHFEARSHTPSIEQQTVTRETLMHIISGGSDLTVVGCTLMELAFPGVAFRPIEGAVLAVSAVHSSALCNPTVEHLMRVAWRLSDRDENWFASHNLIRPSARRCDRSYARAQIPDPSR